MSVPCAACVALGPTSPLDLPALAARRTTYIPRLISACKLYLRIAFASWVRYLVCMAKKKKKEAVIFARVAQEVKDRLVAVAESVDLSEAQVVRRALEAYYKQIGAEVAQ